jgi:hypothetical protein
MEINMIGHASIFVKTKNCRILMDPVLWDPFYEGTNAIYPSREIIHEQLPEFDFLVISHKHTDHFDIRSLAYLPKTVDVLIPRDKLIETSLRKLGYSQIYPLKDFSEVKMGSTSLYTTRSENRVPEYGMVFADDSGVFWNQVDTRVSSTTISSILSRYSKIDFLLATWQPMLEINYQFNQALSFPYLFYNQLLYNISLIQPKAIAPGANGFKYVNGSSWLNQIVFPVTREQFCQDVRCVYPELEQNIFALDPGDILTFNDGEFRHFPGMCDYARKVRDDNTSLEFSPVKIGNDLKDDNPENLDIELMKQVIEEDLLYRWVEFINKNHESKFREHRKWKLMYQLEITFPDGCQKWVFDFSEDKIKPYKGYNPLTNYFSYITASSLYGLIKGTLGMDYTMAGGYYRTYQKVYSVTPFGIIYPESVGQVIADPLQLKFSELEQNPESNRVLELEIEKWGGSNIDSSKSSNSKKPMIKMGDVLLKPTK